MILRLALRELRHSRFQLLAVLWILFLGFLWPLASGALRGSVDDYLQTRSRQILSADLAVSALRPFKEEEIATLDHILQTVRSARATQFVTMAKGKDVATLIEVNGVDEKFPVFGTFERNDGTKFATAEALQTERITWVFPDVLAQLGLKEGETIGIGTQSFRIAAVLDDAPGLTRVGGFAPRLFVARKFVDETGLTQFGSQINHRIYFELPASVPIETATARVKSALADPDIFLRTPDDSVQGFERFFKFLNLYLVTVAMIVFALSWVSAFYILQIFLQERLKNAAIMMTFGASRVRTASLYFVEVFVVMGLALALATAVVALVVRVAPAFVADLVPKDFVLRLSISDVLRLTGIAAVSALAFLVPLFVRLNRLRLQDLLAESAMGAERLPKIFTALTYTLLAGVFLSLSAWLMDSWAFALQLTGGILVVSFLSWFVGRVAFRALFAALRGRPGLPRLVATQLARSRFGMNLCFITLFMVGLVLNLVPHLLKSAIAEVQPLRGREIPSLFLFNIPEATVAPLEAFARERGAELRFLSPMILARLEKVNGEPTRNDQFQRFPIRLSYRSERIPSEVLVQGRDLPKSYDPSGKAMAEISVEERFAERSELEMGDVVEFDVQGVPVSARITSLRRVRWSDFNPNFFIMFQPGVLDDAPKTWLANVNSSATDDEKVKLQYELIKGFPDLNVIDIGRAIERILEVIRSVLGPLRAAAWIAVSLSFLILVSVISHNLRMRSREIDIAKLLGADASLIRRLISSEYLISSSLAVLFGSGSAILLAAIVTQRIFDVPTRIALDAWGASVAVVVAVTTGIAWMSVTRILRLRGTSQKL